MRRYWFIPAGIVLALAIACFFVGWMQLSLAPDTYGVVFTRAHGFEKSSIHPEGITWRWERLIPGALTLYQFPLKAQKAAISVSGTLPSGEVYANLAPEKPDFSFQIDLTILYRLRPEALPGLAETTRLRPDGLSDLYQTLIEQMKSKAVDISLAAAQSSSPSSSASAELEIGSATVSLTAMAARIESELPKDFEHLEFVSLAATVVRMPDFVLYQKLRATYLEMAAAREATLKTAAARLATQQEEQKLVEQKQQQTLSILEKYGELLDKHPALIKFLFLATSKSFSAQDLQNLDILDKLINLE
jgi:hypothetical protein